MIGKQRRDVVLVVDDSADSLSMINDTLENAGMDVLVALEGKQALTIAQRIRPDLILMDALMPQMDGFEACRLLKANPALASIPVIFMTGLTDTEDIVRGLEVGGVDYLIKPVKPNELIARMKVHLANARLTHSAYSALDSTGQHLLTANALGQVLWATPQTYDLLAKANATEEWQNQILSQQLRTWMSQEPDSNSQLSLRGLGYPLFIRLVGSEPNGHRLFRLIDGHKTMDAPLLKEQLNLTDREAEVLYWIANGKTNREVAEILAMSPRTVNKHLEQVFPKLGVENRTAAAGIALRVLSRNQ